VASEGFNCSVVFKHLQTVSELPLGNHRSWVEMKISC
jgi:hypothetical protein